MSNKNKLSQALRVCLLCVAFGVMAVAFMSCVTTQDLRARLATWTGATEDEIIGRWGIPSNTYDSSGTRYIRYVVDEETTTDTSFYNDDDSFFGSSSSVTETYSCAVEFALQGGVVTNAYLRSEERSFINPQDSTHCNSIFVANKIRTR